MAKCFGNCLDMVEHYAIVNRKDIWTELEKELNIILNRSWECNNCEQCRRYNFILTE